MKMHQGQHQDSDKPKFPSYKDHLNKTFLEELNFMIWTTRGARFNASKRLNTVASLSNISLAILSCYLIIISLFSVYQIITDSTISNILTFGATGISILLLVIGQIENAKDYRLRAYQFHNCALELGSIYNQLRIFKTIGEHDIEEKRLIGQKLERRYNHILANHENHDDIDYDEFRLKHSKYFKLTMYKRFIIVIKRYYRVKLIYHLYIIVPLLLGFIYFL